MPGHSVTDSYLLTYCHDPVQLGTPIPKSRRPRPRHRPRRRRRALRQMARPHHHPTHGVLQLLPNPRLQSAPPKRENRRGRRVPLGLDPRAAGHAHQLGDSLTAVLRDGSRRRGRRERVRGAGRCGWAGDQGRGLGRWAADVGGGEAEGGGEQVVVGAVGCGSEVGEGEWV